MENINEVKIKFNDLHYKKAENFLNKYELLSIFSEPLEKFILGKEKDKICRFCKKSETKVTFNEDAHVIPEFLGVHNLLSNFECDSCNDLFSKYEDSLANFFGITRTISKVKGKKNRVPKYKDPRTGLELIFSENELLMNIIKGTNVIDLDKKNKKFIIKTKRPGYVPIYIPKILIKMGICMLIEKELEDFEYTRKFIIDTENESKFENSDLLRIIGYHIPGPSITNVPFLKLYKKKKKFDKEFIPSYQLIFQYTNYQLQLMLPFVEQDKKFQGKNICFPVAPLFVDNSHLEKFGEEQFLNLNLTSAEKKSGEDHIITFSYDDYEKKL